jgi:hypothetical protein
MIETYMIPKLNPNKNFSLKSILLLIGACVIMHESQAQINSVLPNWVRKMSIDSIAPVNKKQVSDGYYYVLLDEQYLKEKRHGYFHYALSAINEESLINVSQIEFSYDPNYQKAVLHNVIIHREGSKIDRTREVSLQVLNEERERGNGILNGKKTIYVNLSDIRKGDIVEYAYSIIGENPILGNTYYYVLSTSFSVPVGKLFYRVILPTTDSVNIKYKNSDVKPTVSLLSGKEYVWNINKPKVTEYESGSPNWFTAYGVIYIGSLGSWEEVKAHCMKLFDLKAYESKGLNKVADSIIALHTNTEDRITALVDFVQTQVRYSGNENGIYSHVPRTPDYVLKNRYGDCKEKSVLLMHLLKSMGVEAFPVLINTSYGKKIKEEFPSVLRFDHTITGLVYNGKVFFMDPTMSHQRGSFMNRTGLNYETGMPLSNKHSVFLDVPFDATSMIKAKEYFYIKESGDMELSASTTFSGRAADNMRYYFLTTAFDNIQKSYKDYYNKYGENIAVADSIKTKDNIVKNEFTIEEAYLIKGFWKPEDSAKSKNVEKSFMPYLLNDKLIYGSEDKRTTPLSIEYPCHVEQELKVYIEGGWNVEKSLKQENNKFFEYSYDTRVKGNEIILSYKYKAKTDVVMPDEYLAFKEKMEFVNNNMVFSSMYTPALEGTSTFNWPLLLGIIFALVATIFAIVLLHKRPYHSGHSELYDSIGGWLILLAIAFVISPLALLFQIITGYVDEFSINYFVTYFKEESPYFSPLRGYYLLFANITNVATLCFTVYLMVLFFQRKTIFRPYYCIFKIVNLCLVLIDLILSYMLLKSSDAIEDKLLLSKETTGFVRLLVGSAIWVPYVWYSERSRGTFTVGNELKKNLESNTALIVSEVESIHPIIESKKEDEANRPPEN